MNLVHCCRCGRLYEDEDTTVMVMESHLPEGKGFIGGICGCGMLGPRRDGIKDWVEQVPKYRQNMWYVDWISERCEKQRIK